ncbi:hypothetical protein [Streptomyces sp. NPDC056227]|uniref:hypothetical protein n=1 Tax=Streptomyces sp. NPDC056227 TaxID=3345753 RepID=UPI0035D61020
MLDAVPQAPVTEGSAAALVRVEDHAVAEVADRVHRNLVAAPEYLLRNRDSRYTQAFDAVLTANGIEILKSAPQTLRMKAHAERLIRTVRAEYTDRRPTATSGTCDRYSPSTPTTTTPDGRTGP